MLGSFDYYGAAALIAAIGAIVASVLTFLARQTVQTVAQHTENIAAAVSTANGHTIGEVADRVDARATGEPVPEGTIKDIPSP
jgi:hypothetical protein